MLEYQVVGLAVGAVAGPGMPDSLPLPEKQQEGGQHPQAVPTTPSGRRETCCLPMYHWWKEERAGVRVSKANTLFTEKLRILFKLV